MRKEKEIAIIRTNEEPVATEGVDYFVLAHARARDEGEVEQFERAIREDLAGVSAKMPGCVDPRILLVLSSDHDAIRVVAKASYSGQKALRFWMGVRFDRCNALSSRWFTSHIAGKKGVQP